MCIFCDMDGVFEAEAFDADPKAAQAAAAQRQEALDRLIEEIAAAEAAAKRR